MVALGLFVVGFFQVDNSRIGATHYHSVSCRRRKNAAWSNSLSFSDFRPMVAACGFAFAVCAVGDARVVDARLTRGFSH